MEIQARMDRERRTTIETKGWKVRKKRNVGTGIGLVLFAALLVALSLMCIVFSNYMAPITTRAGPSVANARDLDKAFPIDPNDARTFFNRGVARSKRKEYDKAIKDYDEAIRIRPRDAASLNELAWLLATCPDAKCRDGKRSVELATKACQLSEWKNGIYIDTLAAAYAEAGNFDEALKWQEKAMQDPEFANAYGQEVKERLALYGNNKPYRIK
jgi:tetratricopeptide (TPR) repeat protein